MQNKDTGTDRVLRTWSAAVTMAPGHITSLFRASVSLICKMGVMKAASKGCSKLDIII
jgi:hypothetical protein